MVARTNRLNQKVWRLKCMHTGVEKGPLRPHVCHVTGESSPVSMHFLFLTQPELPICAPKMGNTAPITSRATLAGQFPLDSVTFKISYLIKPFRFPNTLHYCTFPICWADCSADQSFQ